MLSTILSAFTVADIRKKIAFTALLLALYRLGSHIPVPGIDTKAVNDVQSQFGGGGILNLLNTFSGGGLSRIALFALGIMPYITASIILQLLTVVVPSLEKLQKEGEVGPAADPGPVRQARHRPAHERRRPDLPAAAREHGWRDPGDLRRLDHGLPADRGPAHPAAVGKGHLELLQPEGLGLPAGRDDLHHPLHVLLYGGHVQPRRPGRQPQDVRRLHPGGAPRAPDGRVPSPHPRPA